MTPATELHCAPYGRSVSPGHRSPPPLGQESQRHSARPHRAQLPRRKTPLQRWVDRDVGEGPLHDPLEVGVNARRPGRPEATAGLASAWRPSEFRRSARALAAMLLAACHQSAHCGPHSGYVGETLPLRVGWRSFSAARPPGLWGRKSFSRRGRVASCHPTTGSYGRRWPSFTSHPAGVTFRPTTGALRAFGPPAPHTLRTLWASPSARKRRRALSERCRGAHVCATNPEPVLMR